MPKEDTVSYQEIVKKIEPELEKVIAFLERELSKFKTGRASTSLVENIKVDCFGKLFPLKQLAAISVPEAREILIQPWDKSYIEGIVKALEKSGVAANPIVDKDLIRIRLPSLSEEFRKELIRTISEKQEEAKKTVRRWREEAWREIQENYKEGKIREDDKFKGKDELQDLVDKHNEKIKELGERKKKEILE